MIEKLLFLRPDLWKFDAEEKFEILVQRCMPIIGFGPRAKNKTVVQFRSTCKQST